LKQDGPAMAHSGAPLPGPSELALGAVHKDILARMWRTLVPAGKRRWRPDVRVIRELPV